MPMPTLQRLKTAMKFRPFFFISFLLTAVFYTLLNTFTDWSWSTNLLISWNLAVSSYLVKTMTTLWSVDHRDSHHRILTPLRFRQIQKLR